MLNCKNNNYLLMDGCFGMQNQCCQALDKNVYFRKLVDSGNVPDKYLTTAKNEVLSYHQLTDRARHLSTKINQERLQSLNQNKKLAYLNKTLALHQRFMLLIKNNSVPKLHEIVKDAFNVVLHI